MTTTPRTVLLTALSYRRAALADADRYRDDVNAWYRSGDGRSPQWVDMPGWDADGNVFYRPVNLGGRGYRFPECPHGASLWTDYDNICGGCEDGYDPADRRACLDRAWADYREAQARIEYVTGLARFGNRLPADLRDRLVEWAIEPLPKH